MPGTPRSQAVSKGLQYGSKQDYRKAGKAYREPIALEPDEPTAYFNLGLALDSSGHKVEAAQRFLEARERLPVCSEGWAWATANAFGMLRLEECAEGGTTRSSRRCRRGCCGPCRTIRWPISCGLVW